MTAVSTMERTLAAGPRVDSRRSDHSSSEWTTAIDGAAAPGSVWSAVSAKVALMRRPRTPAIMSFDDHAEDEIAGVTSQVPIGSKLVEAKLGAGERFVKQRSP